MMQACVMFSVCPAVQIYARIISATIKAFFHILAFNIEMGFSFFVKAISTRDPDLVLDTPPPLATRPQRDPGISRDPGIGLKSRSRDF